MTTEATAATDRLEDGWSADTPLGDTVVMRAVRALADSTAVPAARLGARRIRTAELVAADVGRPAGFWNSATVLRPVHGTEAWTALLDRVESFADRDGAEGEFELWSAFQGPDLTARGWECSGHPPLMWRDPGGTAPARPAGLDVARVDDERALRAWATTTVEAFPLDADPAQLIGAGMLDADDVGLYVARLGGTPVGISSVVVAAGCNAIPLIAVRPEARGRGVGAALTWAATRHAPELPAVLYASDAGRGLYERLGYRALLRATFWVRHRPGLQTDRGSTDG